MLLTNASRMREIIAVLWRNGFDGFLQKIQPPGGLLHRLAPKPRSRLTQWERVRITLEELGPTFVKFGQILSMRPDALPEPLIIELQKLQDRVTPVPYEEIEPVLLAGLNGASPGNIFSDFDRAPVASASLAQVYYATLRATGEKVAVKVQRPGIAKKIAADFEILRYFAQKAHQHIENLQPYNLPEIVEELRRGLDDELDFRVEAHNITLFTENNNDPAHITAPRVHAAHSSATVLVMERIEGRKISDLIPGSPEAKLAAARGAASLFHQILVDGFFHADPHAGNLIITTAAVGASLATPSGIPPAPPKPGVASDAPTSPPEASRKNAATPATGAAAPTVNRKPETGNSGGEAPTPDIRVCFLDWGLAGELTRRMRYTLVDLFEAFLGGDSAQVVRVALDLERTTALAPNPRRMEREILHALRNTYDPATGKGAIGRAMLRLLHIFGENGIEVAQDYALVAKAVYTIEETGTRLDPDFTLSANFQPALKRLLAERRNPRALFRDLRRTFATGLVRFQELPAELHRVLRLVESGRATINFQHKGLEATEHALHTASNRMVVGMVIASMIIGSSIIVATKIPPLLPGLEVSALGLVGYLLSALLGLGIVYNILRRGRHK